MRWETFKFLFGTLDDYDDDDNDYQFLNLRLDQRTKEMFFYIYTYRLINRQTDRVQ